MTEAFITTIREHCRMCYTCVRECPAKAIRICDGQAEVIAERCIACGNCVRVCSQGAKQVRSAVDAVALLLRSGSRVAACVAPSFPAEFYETDERSVVGGIRRLGFELVCEVAFGADLVAGRYERLLREGNGRRFIATTCPAVAAYVERYYPNTVGMLAPVVSPMVATARVIHERYGADTKVVFIGPCVAKKVEAQESELAGDVDAVLTFAELREMFSSAGVTWGAVEPSDFDPPHGGAGALFPIGRGMLQAAGLTEDLMTGDIVSTQGRSHMIEAIKEFACGDLGTQLLETLCCEGCIMGAGITSNLPLFSRRRLVREHTCRRMRALDEAQWEKDVQRFQSLDLDRTFQASDQRIAPPADFKIAQILLRMGKKSRADELDCGACGYDTCREHAVAISKGMAESEMCLPNTIEKLRSALGELESSHRELATTQEALRQSEKLASMGQLAAGVAHEVNNPLGVVLMYAHLLLDECDSQSPLRDDLMMIVEQADRCKKIVAGLLGFARQNKVMRTSTNIPDLISGLLRAVKVPESVAVARSDEMADPMAEVDRDQIVQVLTNLVNNAVHAMDGRGTLTIRTSDDAQRIRFGISDTGVGIPPENIKKIFEPFFTTKRGDKGTGLGLAVTYGIVKMHRGDIRVESNVDPAAGPTGTTFTVTLPRCE